jgi:signal transduction histidine kinase/DNA-binding response OmpR family regulator/HPt (histidine-containing phosphotransfer) domain-containing protein
MPPLDVADPKTASGLFARLSARMRIGRKLSLAFMVTAIMAGTGIGVTNYFIARNALIEQAQSQLMVLAQSRQAAVSDFLATMEADIGFIATSFWMQDAVAEMQTAWGELNAWTRERYTVRRQTAKQLRATLPENVAPDTLEQVEALAALEQLYFKFGPELRGFVQTRGYADLVVVGADGVVLFSAARRHLLGRNLRDDSMADTPPAKAFRLALDRHRSGRAALSDFAFSPEREDMPTAHIAALITGEGRQFLGALVLELPIDRFSEITNRPTGLGERGDMALVGPDGVLRSNSRLISRSTLLTARVDAPPVRKALSGMSLTAEFDRVYARPDAPERVLAALVPLNYGDQRWVVMTSMPVDELLAPVVAMGELSLIGGGGILALVLLGSFGIAQSITRPIRDITQIMLRLAGNDSEARVPHQQRHDELGWMAGALEVFRQNVIRIAQLRDEAEQAARAKAMFLATMSHEIRTPMNGVLSMSALLDQTRLDDDQRSMLSVVRQSAGALLTVINDILDFSKIEAGKLDVEALEMSLPETVESVGELLNLRAEEKGIEFVVDIADNVPDQVIGDPTRIRQILFNLAGNAIKFTDEGAVTVHIAAASADGASDLLRFEVADTGIGLTKEQQTRLFQPFSQADGSTARRFGGTGLGLSISLGLVELMGGKIGVDSVFGRGSTFWFELPLPSCGENAVYAPSVADARVLCVGQTAATGAALASAVRRVGAASVERAETVEAALARFADISQPLPNILLVDARLIDRSARALLESLSEWAGDAKPVMLLTCRRAEAATLLEAERAGFFAALPHPIRRGRLHRALAAALGLLPKEAAKTTPHSATAQVWRAPDLETAKAAGAAVLAAEDNPTNQIVLKRILDRCGVAHAFAADGVEALAELRRAPGAYALLLTDFHMPRMDGFELTAKIREQEAADSGKGRPAPGEGRLPPGEGRLPPGEGRLPIVALTADALPGTRERCLAAGMDDYLSKPIEIEKLADLIERLAPAVSALREAADEPASARNAAGADDSPRRRLAAIDPEIFNAARLEETFGVIDGEALTFLAGFLERAQELTDATLKAFADNDAEEARRRAHALKGSALAVGADRLGRIAGDVQDLLDAGDIDSAPIFADALPQTLNELKAALAPILPPCRCG